MFEQGIYKTGIATAFNLTSEVDTGKKVNIKVDVIDDKLVFTSGDWKSYYTLYQKLNQLVLSMKECIRTEGSKDIKYLV